MTITQNGQREDSLEFGIEYDGTALTNNEMDVRQLAPALLSTGNLFQNLNRIIHPTDRDVQVNIRATSEGSFALDLKLLYDKAQDALGSREMFETEGLAGLLSSFAVLVAFLKKRGKAGTPDSETTDHGTVQLSWPVDHTVMEMHSELFRNVDNPTIRKPLAEVVGPLDREGIDSLRVIRGGAVISEVESDDLPSFQEEAVREGEILNTWDRTLPLQILTSAWQVGRKWRFYDGRWPFWAQILDEDFNNGLRNGERYGSRDTLTCEVREVQWRDDAGLHTEITILRVISRTEAPQQPTLGIA